MSSTELRSPPPSLAQYGSRPDKGVPAHAWLLIIALVLGIFSGHWGVIGVPLPLDRLALVGSFVTFGWAWLQFRTEPVQLRTVHYAMVATVLFCILSAVVFGTLTDRGSMFALLDRVVMPYVGFAFAPLALATPASRRRLMQALTVTGLYVGLTAIFSVWGPEALLFPRYLVDGGIGIGQGRARGPSAEAVGTGLMVIICGTAAALNAARNRGVERALSTAAVLVCTLAGFLSLTRSIWLSMVVVFVACLSLMPSGRRNLLVVGVGATAIIGAVLLFVPGVSSAALDRLGTERSLDDRAYTNEAALRMVFERPITGVGWGRFTAESPDYVFQHDTAPLTSVGIEVHNVFLSRAAELGMPGLLLTIAVVLLGPLRAVLHRRLRQPLDGVDVRLLAAAAVLAWLVTSLVTGLSFAFANLLAWVLAGLAYHQTTQPRTEEWERADG